MGKHSLFLLFIFSWISTFAQKIDKSDRFGKLNPVEINSTICPIDSNAHAYYLFDHGNSSFLILPELLKIVFERHFRIKILDKSAFDQGTFSIPLFRTNNKEEELSNLKAITYNQENGKMIETKMEKASIYKENASDHIKNIKFTLPNIKVGSILEVKYTIQSDFLFNYQGWVFQHDLPVLESEYITDIPDVLIYNPHFWGYHQVNKVTTTKKSQENDFAENISIYSAKNIPAFPNEPYVSNKDNYRTRLEFELASTQIGIYENYTSNWKALNDKLLNNENFGLQLAKTGYFKKEIAPIKDKNLPLNAKIYAAYALIQKNIKWDNNEGIYTTANIKKAFDEGKGNVADINLALISMLRELGVNAYPVLLSTRENGYVLQGYPTLTQFNYVIAGIIDGDKTILLDAANPFSTPSLLSPKCLNGFGRLVNDQEGQWIDLKANRISQRQVNYKVNLDPGKGLLGSYIERNYFYAGFKLRSNLKDTSGLKQYIEKVHEQYKDFKLMDATLSQFNEYDKEVIIEAKLESKLGLELSDDLIYFNPMQLERFTENPFRIVDRKFPIEFEYPWMVNATFEVKIPDNYTIESMPKSGVFQNASKSAKFTFVSDTTAGMIKVGSMISMQKARYGVEEYEGLKELFSHIVGKHAEQIVLRKKG